MGCELLTSILSDLIVQSQRDDHDIVVQKFFFSFFLKKDHDIVCMYVFKKLPLYLLAF